jgi:hypothetical protein
MYICSVVIIICIHVAILEFENPEQKLALVPLNCFAKAERNGVLYTTENKEYHVSFDKNYFQSEQNFDSLSSSLKKKVHMNQSLQ